MRYFPVSDQRYGCQCFGSLTCTQMLLHAISHEGCTDTVRESALNVDSGRKIHFRTGESNLPQRRAGSTLYQLSYIPSSQELRCSCTQHFTQSQVLCVKVSFFSSKYRLCRASFKIVACDIFVQKCSTADSGNSHCSTGKRNGLQGVRVHWNTK